MDNLLKKLNINETFTKEIRGIKFDKVKQNVYPKGGYNAMADLLHLPTTKYRYRYLLVITDLWSNNFDIEPIRNKTPDDVLKAMKKIMSTSRQLHKSCNELFFCAFKKEIFYISLTYNIISCSRS